ncbi:MAG TPA: hypothetical protein VFO65_08790, partial [Acidimicrobiales bacterium]|nr:hypothetical protein [Acidimicrobiales bacterium]
MVKLAFLAAVNGLAVYGAYVMADRRSWAPLAVTVAATVAIDWVYLGRRRIAAKYLIPGTVFLLAFQVYPVLYNVYVSFTNYGTGNLLTKSQALDRILSGSVVATDAGERYQMVPVTDGDTVGLLLTAEDGRLFLGTEEGLRPVDEADLERDAGGAVSGYRDFRRMTVREAQDRQDDVTGLRVPVEGGFVRAETFTSASTVVQRLSYDDRADTVTDRVTGAVYRPEDGVFTSPEGAELRP